MRPEIVDVKVSDHDLTVELSNGRNLSVSLELFPRLLEASKEERDNWHLIAGRIGIHWPELDEDIASRTFLEVAGDQGQNIE